jgi:hypothetical protein
VVSFIQVHFILGKDPAIPTGYEAEWVPVSLDMVGKRKTLDLPGIELQSSRL